VLAELGLGPESVLMREPKLFVDDRFLGAFVIELEDELGIDQARVVLFQIGLTHGFRNALRVLSELPGEFTPSKGVTPEATALAIQLGPHRSDGEAGGISIAGRWPEGFEAAAWLSKLGPGSDPTCALSAGYTSGWLSGTFDADILALESNCRGRGDAECCFEARELELWASAGNERASALLRDVCFETSRELGRPERPIATTTDLGEGSFDPEAGVVHIWGPVMVLPYRDADEALQTVEMLGRDPETSTVRVVVVDLRETILDQEFGAAAVEHILECIDAWGAEALLTGVSPLSEEVVAGLEASHVLVRKALPEAIAVAFQIAHAQRHIL
jgi:hypothetical protein